jgi:uncharacterized protein YggE
MSHKNDHFGTLEINGEGRIDVKPDVAVVRLSVVTEGKTADEAASKNAQKMNEVVERFTRLEIPRDDMNTTGLNIYPIYHTESGSDVTTVIGYRVQNSITAKVPVQLASKAFDLGVAAGANESSGISFELRNERPYRQQALDLAIKGARAEAEAVCHAMGVTLKGPRSIQVIQGGGPVRMDSERLTAKAATPLLPGRLAVAAEVRVTFEYDS